MTLPIRKRSRWIALVALAAMTLPGVAFAHDGNAKPESSPSEDTAPVESPPVVTSVLSTLPVLGSGLEVTITRDENGALASVALDPSEGSTTVKERDHKLVFLLGDGDTEVLVASFKGVVQTKVRADDPVDVSGDAVWVGDVFGTGEVSVPYSVAFDGIVPKIAVGAVTGPDDVTAEVGEGKAKSSEEGNRALYAIKVKLTSGEHRSVLVLKAHAKVDEDGETRVSVSASLVSRDRVNWWWGDKDDRDRWMGSDERDRKDRDSEDRGDDERSRWDGERAQSRDVGWNDRWGDDDRRDRDGDRDWSEKRQEHDGEHRP